MTEVTAGPYRIEVGPPVRIKRYNGAYLNETQYASVDAARAHLTDYFNTNRHDYTDELRREWNELLLSFDWGIYSDSDEPPTIEIGNQFSYRGWNISEEGPEELNWTATNWPVFHPNEAPVSDQPNHIVLGPFATKQEAREAVDAFIVSKRNIGGLAFHSGSWDD